MSIHRHLASAKLLSRIDNRGGVHRRNRGRDAGIVADTAGDGDLAVVIDDLHAVVEGRPEVCPVGQAVGEHPAQTAEVVFGILLEFLSGRNRLGIVVVVRDPMIARIDRVALDGQFFALKRHGLEHGMLIQIRISQRRTGESELEVADGDNPVLVAFRNAVVLERTGLGKEVKVELKVAVDRVGSDLRRQIDVHVRAADKESVAGQRGLTKAGAGRVPVQILRNLAGRLIQTAHFGRHNLAGRLRRSNIRRGILRRSNIRRGVLRRGNIRRGVLRGGNVRRSVLRRGNVRRSVLGRGNIRRNILRRDIRRGVLRGGNIRRNILGRGNLRRNVLRRRSGAGSVLIHTTDIMDIPRALARQRRKGNVGIAEVRIGKRRGSGGFPGAGIARAGVEGQDAVGIADSDLHRLVRPLAGYGEPGGYAPSRQHRGMNIFIRRIAVIYAGFIPRCLGEIGVVGLLQRKRFALIGCRHGIFKARDVGQGDAYIADLQRNSLLIAARNVRRAQIPEAKNGAELERFHIVVAVVQGSALEPSSPGLTNKAVSIGRMIRERSGRSDVILVAGTGIRRNRSLG